MEVDLAEMEFLLPALFITFILNSHGIKKLQGDSLFLG